MARNHTITETVTLVTESCCNCGVVFAMASDFRDQRIQDQKTFYCPAGHGQSYYGETDAEKLRKERMRTQHLRDQLEAAEKSAKSYKGHFTRVKKQVERAENGVCPHCKRSFQNLRRHVETQHEHVLRGEDAHG